MSLIPRSLWIAVGVLALAAAALLGSYRAGSNAADARWQAAQADAARAANKKLLAAVEQGIQASEGLRTALAQQTTQYTQLERTFHDLRSRIRLITAGPVPATAARPAAGQPNSTAVAVADAAGDPAQLSRAALWMWNSALAGRDVPADSCGLADTSDAACAPGSGAFVDSAFANHELNARACAVDRLRYQHLIDFLNGRTATQSGAFGAHVTNGAP